MTSQLARAGLAAALLLVACTSGSATDRALRNVGLTPVDVGGWAPFSCNEDDEVRTSFRARRADGQIVSGAVCCGLLLRGCTVRFE